MKAGGALVLTADAREAASRAVGEARASLGDLPPSLAVLFASSHFFGAAQDLVTAVAAETGRLPLIGCVAEAVAGGAREVESGPAVALWLAAGGRSPDDLRPVHVPRHRSAGPPELPRPRGVGHGRPGQRGAAAGAEPAVSGRAGAAGRRGRRPPAARRGPSPGGAGMPPGR